MVDDSRFQALEKKVEQILAIVVNLENQAPLADRRGARGPCPPRSARSANERRIELEALEAKWQPVKERWPNWTMHPKAMEAIERHTKTLGGEPSMEKLHKAVSGMEPDLGYERQHLEKMFKMDSEHAQAVQYFLKISGLCRFEKGTGLVKN